MHWYLLQEIVRQREEDFRRAARQRGPAGPCGHRPVTAARTVRPGGEPTRSKPWSSSRRCGRRSAKR